jgi:16S rRNA processing protein RimM
MSPVPQNLIVVGVFGAAHGLKGELRLKSYTQEPLAIANYGPLTTKSGRVVKFSSLRQQKDMLVVRVEGVNDRSAAEQYVNLQLFAARDALGQPEDEDEFFHADLIGLAARDAQGTLVGSVTGLFDFGAGDIVEITPEGGKPLLLPFTKAAVPSVDIKAGHILVVLPEETGNESEEDRDDER